MALFRPDPQNAREAWLFFAIVLVGLLLAAGVRAEEPSDEARPVVLDVGDGVTCKVPGVSELVPLPPGKMVPTHLWLRLDDRFRVLEAEVNRVRAERAETERQFAERLAQVIVGSLAVGIAAGAVGTWIVLKPP